MHVLQNKKHLEYVICVSRTILICTLRILETYINSTRHELVLE